MSVEEVEVPDEKFSSIHPKAVFEHRFARFMEMGFGPSESSDLAETRADVHQVRRFLSAGCSFELALQILL